MNSTLVRLRRVTFVLAGCIAVVAAASVLAFSVPGTVPL